MADHPVQKAAALHFQADLVGGNLCHNKTSDLFARVDFVWEGVGKVTEVVPAHKPLSGSPEVRNEYVAPVSLTATSQLSW